MSSKEVKATEQTVQEIINGNNAVYAKESTLALAKEIKGIRAIFDEVIVCEQNSFAIVTFLR